MHKIMWYCVLVQRPLGQVIHKAAALDASVHRQPTGGPFVDRDKPMLTLQRRERVFRAPGQRFPLIRPSMTKVVRLYAKWPRVSCSLQNTRKKNHWHTQHYTAEVERTLGAQNSMCLVTLLLWDAKRRLRGSKDVFTRRRNPFLCLLGCAASW